MDEIGIEIQRNEPTFESVVSEKTALLQELQEKTCTPSTRSSRDTWRCLRSRRAISRTSRPTSSVNSFVRKRRSNAFKPSHSTLPLLAQPQDLIMWSEFFPPLTANSSSPLHQVALHRHSNALVDILPPEADSSISMLGKEEKPDVTYQDVGGMDSQKQEIREAVELPLTHFDLYRKIGIDPPRGVLLYGPPGTGKTMLVKAVAHHTTAAFIRVVGSEFVQKYLGEGPRMVRDVFRLARENSPAIIFIDEIDAIATKRFDAQTGADREVQRILLELLNQMDGFDQGSNVKVIMATNRADTLDPALLRPGRLDRKIEFPRPSRREKRLIFQTVTSKMNLGPDVDLEDYVSRPDPLSSADITSIVQAAGLQAVRKNRYVILPVDFEEAWKQTVKRSDETHEFSISLCILSFRNYILSNFVEVEAFLYPSRTLDFTLMAFRTSNGSSFIFPSKNRFAHLLVHAPRTRIGWLLGIRWDTYHGYH
ncbi:putative RPT3-26S proteasome regulatory subunit [Lyophyllum atratum]|nr:putative RPT3-26S proteasome regulatory subunit [Lyophyllum atratum]